MRRGQRIKHVQKTKYSITNGHPIQARIGSAAEGTKHRIDDDGLSAPHEAVQKVMRLEPIGWWFFAGNNSCPNEASRAMTSDVNVGSTEMRLSPSTRTRDASIASCGFIPRSITLSRICTCPCGCMFAPMQPKVMYKSSSRKTIDGITL